MTNKPEVSPAMTAEQMVKAVYPDAVALDCHEIAGDYNIYSVNNASAIHLGRGTSTSKAWVQACTSLPASPVAEGESDAPICPKCNRKYEWNPAVDAYEHDDPCEVGSMETGKSADKWDALRKAAEATELEVPGPWEIVEVGNDDDGYSVWIESKDHSIAEVFDLDGRNNPKKHKNPQQMAIAAYLALANPAVILELLNELATLSVTEGVDGWIDCKQELPPDSKLAKAHLDELATLRRPERNAMKYEVMQDKRFPKANEWRVEAIDFDGDGDCYVTLFGGPNAENRAEEYAIWKSSLDATKGDRG